MDVLKIAAVALFLSGCVAPTQPVVGSTSDFSDETLRLINAYRSSSGLRPLSPHPVLQQLARQHSERQARGNRMSHDGYRQRAAQAKRAGLTARCAENVGYRQRDARHLFTLWKNSPGHNVNLLRPNLRYAGMSVVNGYSTYFACG
ncbi:CAP domain-containing protein [Nitratireductor thuwali]|uniref:SCP domain-containing protein n=1 Tax=Nitratireductor thuwali TaxID=2267699 RepID=A0ABY5MEY2_9HYPH|nr:hypothetical protein NTH_01041 [Nitratireductor thuwali]